MTSPATYFCVGCWLLTRRFLGAIVLCVEETKASTLSVSSGFKLAEMMASLRFCMLATLLGLGHGFISPKTLGTSRWTAVTVNYLRR